MCFTPKTYIARSIFVLTCVTYKKLVPSTTWEVIKFFIYSIHLFNAHLLPSLYQDSSRASYEHTVLYPKQEL